MAVVNYLTPPPGTFQNYFWQCRLGAGACSAVHEYRHKYGSKVAVKINHAIEYAYKLALVELKILQELKGVSHVVQLEKYEQLGPMQVALFLELAPGMNLRQHLANGTVFQPDQIVHITRNVLFALEHLERLKIVTGDLKPDNIVFCNKSNSIRLVDFGLGVCLRDFESNSGKEYPLGYTVHYRAPEFYFGKPYTTSVDIWALGAMLTDLCLGAPFFNGGIEKFGDSEEVRTHNFDLYINMLYQYWLFCGSPPVGFLDDCTHNLFFVLDQKTNKPLGLVKKPTDDIKFSSDYSPETLHEEFASRVGARSSTMPLISGIHSIIVSMLQWDNRPSAGKLLMSLANLPLGECMALSPPSLAGFTFIRDLAEGGSSKVFLFKDRLGKEYAVKVNDPSPSLLPHVLKEIEILGKIEGSPLTAKLSEYVMISPHQYAIIMDYIPCRPLSEVCMESRQTIEKVRKTMLDMLYALAHLRERKIIHGDVKESNILVDPDGNAKLVDFGLSYSYENGGTPHFYPICTITHRPPEVILEGPLDSDVDTWSLGMAMCSGYLGKFLLYAGSDSNETVAEAEFKNFQIDVNYLHHMEHLLGPIPVGLVVSGNRSHLFYQSTEEGNNSRVYTLKFPNKYPLPLQQSIKGLFLAKSRTSFFDNQTVAKKVASVIEQMIRWQNRITPKEAISVLLSGERSDVDDDQILVREINNWSLE